MIPRHLLRTLAVVLAAAALGACAQRIGDIDRVDDNVIPKSTFDGQWYMLQTITDTNATAASFFAGLQGQLERVHFQFSEDFLIARRVHENIMGFDNAATNLQIEPEFDASIVAAWGIQHLDVQRSYNPSTGEESNVIGENMSDRRWYEREHLRGSWTSNHIEFDGNRQFAAYLEAAGKYQITLQPEESEDTLHIEYDEDGNANYFEYVTRYIVDSDWWTCFELVGFPMWGTDCGTDEVVVRTSFRRVEVDDVENAHVPRRYDDYDMGLFGFFRTNRCYADDRYNCTDYSRVSIANVYDIWDGERDADGTALPYHERTPKPVVYYVSEEYPIDLIDEAYEIAEQYSYAFRRAVASAQGKSIDEIPRMFYACFNPGSTDPEVPEEWRSVTYNPDDLTLLEQAAEASAFAYQNGICKRPGEVKNLGDIRYSFFNWRTDPAAAWYGYGPSAADPLTGEIVQAAANFNGGHLNRHSQRILNYVKIIEGDMTAEEYGYGVPIQEWFERRRQEADYDLYFGLDRTPGVSDDKAPGLERARSAEVRRALRSIEDRNESHALVREVMERPYMRGLLERSPDDFRMRNGREADPFSRVVGTPLEQDAMLPEFVEHFSLGTYDPQATFDTGPGSREWTEDDWLDVVSPVRIAQALTVQNRHERMRSRAMEQNIIMADDFDFQVVGFAEEIYRYKAQLEERFPEWDADQIDYELWLEIRGRIYTGIQAHEIGHTVGFRHNFIGTADALNYFPQYWALRGQTFDEDCDGNGYRTFSPTGYAEGNVAPELCGSDETDTEYAERSRNTLARMRSGVLEDGTQVGSIDHYEYSTVMDYHGDFNGRQGGLGLYDYAAIAYGYAEMVEVFNEAPHRLDVVSEWDTDTGNFSDTTVGRLGEAVTDMDDVENWRRRYRGGTTSDVVNDHRSDNGWSYWHYSVLPIMFYDEASSVDTENIASARHPDHIDFTGVGAMASMYNRSLVSASDCQGAECTYCNNDGDCGGGQTCYRNPMEPRQVAGSVPGYCVDASAGAPLLGASDVRVPYRFCSDYLRGSSAMCNIFDSGADEYEVVTRLVRDYESYYPVSAFRRGRPSFGLWLWPYLSSMMSYTFGPAIAQYQYWLLSASGRGPEWYLADRGGLHSTIAMQDALNFVSGVWTTPTVGTYAPDDELDGMYVNVATDTGERFDSYNERFGHVPDEDYIDLSTADGARYGYSQFYRRREDEQAPYYYFYQYDVLSHFWAKYAAVIAFTDGSVDIIGADTDSDSTAFYIPPYLAFPDDVANLFGAMISEDYGNFGVCASKDETGGWSLDNIDMIRSATYRCGGTVLNPFTAVYGNRDYNMQYLSTLFAAANFSANLDYSWLDQSSVYVWGRGETPSFIEDDEQDFEWVTYTDERGTTYAARYVATVPNLDYDPEEDDESEARLVVDPDDYNSDRGPNVGYRMVQRAIDMQQEYEELVADWEDYENDVPGAFRPVRSTSDLYYDIQNHLEMIRFLVETNKVFQW